MRGMIVAFALLLAGAPAFAQNLTPNLTLGAPDWATHLLGADVLPTNGGRAVLAKEGVDLSVRVTISPYHGGVARIVRFDSGPSTNMLALRRFTGHPTTGYWLWGSDQPIVTAPEGARGDIERLARAVANAPATTGQRGAAQTACANGERIFIEVLVDGRATRTQRDCMGDDDAGQLARRLSDLAGSRDEDELIASARSELLAVDRAFSARVASNGLAAALADYRAQNMRPAPNALARTPAQARVSTRGDMGWTSGRLANGQTYVTVWVRDYEGNWKIAADAARTVN